MQTEVVNSNIEKHKATDNACTSRKFAITPIRSAHNMNDMEILKYQSADDVSNTEKEPYVQLMSSLQMLTRYVIKKCDDCRQTMKAVLSKKLQKDYDDEADARSTPESRNKVSHDSASRKVKKPDNILGHVLLSQTICKSPPPLRKRGRPPKAGPSKKLKVMKNVAELYKGKLSNLVRTPGMGSLDATFSGGDW